MSNWSAGDDKVAVMAKGKYRRRLFLSFIAGSAVGIAGYEYQTTGNLGIDLPGTGSNANEMSQSFGGGFVSKIEFEDRSMAVTLRRNHNAEALAVWHVADDVERQSPIETYGMYGIRAGTLNEPMPRYEGTVIIPIVDAIEKIDADFPSRRFRLVGFAGTPSERVGDVVFTIPEQLMS